MTKTFTCREEVYHKHSIRGCESLLSVSVYIGCINNKTAPESDIKYIIITIRSWLTKNLTIAFLQDNHQPLSAAKIIKVCHMM